MHLLSQIHAQPDNDMAEGFLITTEDCGATQTEVGSGWEAFDHSLMLYG